MVGTLEVLGNIGEGEKPTPNPTTYASGKDELKGSREEKVPLVALTIRLYG
jgi:hypothetical protein